MPVSIRLFIGFIVSCFVAYACSLIWSSSFLVNGARCFALFDDAMISMRYAGNLADGYGLVWNSGERVEGFTNPGWTFIMTLIHVLESRENLTSLYMQIISALFLAGAIVMTALLAMRVGSKSPVVAAAAAAAVAFYFPLNYFSLMGMETGILAFMVTAAVYMLVRAGEAGRASWGAWMVLAAATFVRLDAVVPGLALAGAVLISYPAQRIRNLLFAATAIAGGLILQTLVRLWYYGDPLPNTYYLKMTEVPLLTRVGRGMWVTSRFFFNHFWPFFVLIPFATIAVLRHRQKAGEKLRCLLRSPAALLLCIVIGQIAYSTYVGGDVWEWFLYANRFLVIAVPALFILLAQLVVILLGRWPVLASSMRRYPAPWAVILGTLLIIQSNWHGGFEFAREQALLRRPLYGVSDAAAFVHYAQHVKATRQTTTTIAIDRAGTLPYFLREYRFYDILGKSDAVIARMPSRNVDDPGSMLGNHFVPGHTKWDAAYTVGHLNPDILIFTADFMEADYEPWLKEKYLRVDSRGIPGRIFRKK